jgi:hypothetical protein
LELILGLPTLTVDPFLQDKMGVLAATRIPGPIRTPLLAAKRKPRKMMRRTPACWMRMIIIDVMMGRGRNKIMCLMSFKLYNVPIKI